MNILKSIIIFLCLTAHTSAYARLRSELITPTNTTTPELTFQVSLRDHGNITFSITATPTGQQMLSTNITGKALLKDADGLIAECPISPVEENNSLTYTFSIGRKLVEKSTLSITSRHDIMSQDPTSGENVGRIAAGTVFYIQLSDFMKNDP